ncbi:hypothetical protein D9758_012525 [Tetrapyrgos nigripes]|uniref:Integrase core domain-containing protein n=1 Tax=Tetrapyrgos nigripes TaxID=182062 RepID=A0A8H5G358_9AGAR|nr:hypothetical protein D9758_012525 [Tetrapyrgos nigripes]
MSACQENDNLRRVPMLKVYLMAMDIGHGNCCGVHCVVHTVEEKWPRSMSLPPLPPPSITRHNANWPPNVTAAEQTLRNIYQASSQVLALPSVDPRRMDFHLRAITSDAVPLIIALDDFSPSKKLRRWVSECAEEFAGMCLRLTEAGNTQDHDQNNPNLEFPNPVTAVRTGKRGRPRKFIDPSYLRKALAPKRRINVSELARTLKVSRQTLTSYLKRHNIDYKFSNISNDQLDQLVKDFQERKPASGIRYLTRYLRRSGYRLQKRRIIGSLRRVDQLGHVLRARRVRKTQRVPYLVSCPNALWHIDGHHKLILWGIVIHGCIDGYSRKVSH